MAHNRLRESGSSLTGLCSNEGSQYALATVVSPCMSKPLEDERHAVADVQGLCERSSCFEQLGGQGQGIVDEAIKLLGEVGVEYCSEAALWGYEA